MNGLYHVKQKDGNLNLWKNSKKRYSPVQKMAKLAIDTQISTILNDILVSEISILLIGLILKMLII